MEANRKNVEFAKNLFQSWDDDGSGTLEAQEIIKPLVQLGLAPDAKFARKMLNSLDSRTQEEKEESDLKITLNDFIKIFRSSKASQKLLSLIEAPEKSQDNTAATQSARKESDLEAQIIKEMALLPSKMHKRIKMPVMSLDVTSMNRSKLGS